MQSFLMAVFCWMLIKGIDLYFFVVKVYNINTKVYMYHVISWGKFIISQFALETVIMPTDHQKWYCQAVKCFHFLPFFVGRSVPVMMVAISLGIATGKKKKCLQSYTSDK